MRATRRYRRAERRPACRAKSPLVASAGRAGRARATSQGVTPALQTPARPLSIRGLARGVAGAALFVQTPARVDLRPTDPQSTTDAPRALVRTPCSMAAEAEALPAVRARTRSWAAAAALLSVLALAGPARAGRSAPSHLRLPMQADFDRCALAASDHGQENLQGRLRLELLIRQSVLAIPTAGSVLCHRLPRLPDAQST